MLSQSLQILSKTKAKKEEVRATIISMTVLHWKYLGSKCIKLNKKRKVVVTDNSLLNGISVKKLSRNHQLTVKKFPDGTSEKLLEKMENLVV